MQKVSAVAGVSGPNSEVQGPEMPKHQVLNFLIDEQVAPVVVFVIFDVVRL